MVVPNMLTLLTPVDLMALLAVVVIGLPHGALDGAVAMHLGFTHKLLHFLRFLGLYVIVAATVVGAWLVAPVLTLIGFLVISIFHFGSGDARTERVETALRDHRPRWSGRCRYQPDAPCRR